MAFLAGKLVYLLIPGFTSLPGESPATPFAVGFDFLLAAFFLPFLWWRTTVGYVGAVIVGILALGGQTLSLIAVSAAGALAGELYIIIIPQFVFALLLIGSSVLAWREG